MNLPPLKTLPVFEAVARLNSFSLAANELHITQSAVSHHIKTLEDHLGEQLFIRSGRKLELTTEGKLYLDNITGSLNQIARATENVKGVTETKLRLAVYSSFAVYWLIPRLPNLKRQYPNLDLTIEMTFSEPELSDRTADCFITIESEKRGFDFEWFYTERLFPVCNQSFYQELLSELNVFSDKELQHELKTNPEVLARFPLITSYSMYESYAEDWRRWFKEQGKELPDDINFHRFSHLMLAHEAAAHSLGIALVNDYMFNENDPKDGLIKLPCVAHNAEDRFYIAYKHSRRHEPALKQLRHWLRNELNELT
ncbi:Glycine cleavage system transcriptional activator [Marinomonas gallaica]|uniref:Glycine cleavage system transcriptional activator n=1 Tax=Marinomonas gallaica TaxID=1806667 RepID=A0A1C3JSN3_9GAMM|nr:LysR substrate-binding domain-containing protein [Marinomonas gallaica]SBT18059.1 Glycine cleavage system transcriptional activator [Marinomonas gallaica]SBT22439.1 Glycine cleavage system transcriptional activator [Marinomonas gallaica]